jgi:acyl-CoA reductase-like NAD-dependent aldehyde dehydrogenase
MTTASAGIAIPDELTSKTNLIAGDWVDARSGERFEVRSPATGEVLAEVPSCAPADVDAAVAAAKAA